MLLQKAIKSGVAMRAARAWGFNIVVFLSLVLVGSVAPAWGFDFFGDFEAPEITVETKTDKKTQAEGFWSHFNLFGDVSLSTAFDWDHDEPEPGKKNFNGLSRHRLKLYLGVDTQLSQAWKTRVSGLFWYDFVFDILGKEDYEKSFVDSMKDQTELWETWVQGPLLPGLDLRFGRQIVVWGTSETLRVTDVINPVDNREPGMTDIEDIRLPLLMTRLDYSLGRWSFTNLFIHEMRPDKLPAWGSPYYPFEQALPYDNKPSMALDNLQWGFAVNGRLTGLDVALYLASYFDHVPYFTVTGSISGLNELVDYALNLEPPTSLEDFDPGNFTLPPSVAVSYRAERRYSRLTMIGAAATFTKGSWILKGEAAHTEGHRFLLIQDREKERFDWLLGVEYMGFSKTTLSLEGFWTHYPSFETLMEYTPEAPKQSQAMLAGRITRDFLRDKLRIIAVGLAAGDWGNDGWFFRTQADYDWADGIAVTLGVTIYGSGNLDLYKTMDKNDRIFAQVKYSF